MKPKIIISFLILLSILKIQGMENEFEVTWKDIPDELIISIFHFSLKGSSLKDAIKQLIKYRSLEKRCHNIDKDFFLMKTIIILHVNDDDYQEVLNKVLFRAAYAGNDNLIEMLDEIPEAVKKSIDGNIEFIKIDQSDPAELSVETNHKEKTFLQANANNLDVFGNTVLIIAAEQGHKEIVKKLLSYVENIDFRGFGKDTAFLATAKECLYVSDENKEDNYLKILKLLASQRADVNVLDAANLSVMDMAIQRRKIKLINLLLDLGAHFSKQNKDWIEYSLSGMTKHEDEVKLFERSKALEEKSIMIEVEFDLKNEPRWLSFKIENDVYKTEVNNDITNTEFGKKVTVLDDGILSRIGDSIVEMVFAKGIKPNSIVNNSSYDPNDHRLALQIIFGRLLRGPYDLAEEHDNQEIMRKITEIVKPIFKAYPEKDTSVYGNNLKKYDINN